MNNLKLSPEEEDLLISHFKKSPVELVRLKAQAVRMRSRNLSIEQISFSLVRSERTIKRWISDFAKRRLATLFSGQVGNQNASKLTRKQKMQIK